MRATPITPVGIGENRLAWVAETGPGHGRRARPGPEEPPPFGL
jgi:hypothetical protein